MNHQDWEPVVIRSSSKTTPKTGPKVSEAGHIARKAENTEFGKLKMLTHKSRSEMAQARIAKSLTQKQLDQRCQFPANSCNLWEAGKMCPSGPQLNILHRILGIKLERE